MLKFDPSWRFNSPGETPVDVSRTFHLVRRDRDGDEHER